MRFQPRNGILKDTNGKIATDSKEIKERWQDYSTGCKYEVDVNMVCILFGMVHNGTDSQKHEQELKR